MDDQTTIFFLKIYILVGTSMYTHDRACACTRRTPLSLTLILGANIIYCKPQNRENVGLEERDLNLVRIK